MTIPASLPATPAYPGPAAEPRLALPALAPVLLLAANAGLCLSAAAWVGAEGLSWAGGLAGLALAPALTLAEIIALLGWHGLGPSAGRVAKRAL